MNEQAARLMDAEKNRKEELRKLWQNVKHEDLQQKEAKKRMDRDRSEQDRR